ncbi:hypothetical protein Sxan_00880 [Streptomyces xanthophaeus]|uniref:Uncharacterized protein n=1 Tax=Streptomyces xanthophaeus TaxID=67385 RepID=A0A919GSH3_9ACTN|nr:hypothetical protein Sxan_00880 [Streptomyces xanthophaeus]
MLAGLLRSEEPEAPPLFDQVLEELGLLFHPPADPRAAKWDMASWVAGQIADGSLDPAVGTHLIRADIAHDLGDPVELQPLVHCAYDLDGWEESWESPSRNSTGKRLRRQSGSSARGRQPRRGPEPQLFAPATWVGLPASWSGVTQRGCTEEAECPQRLPGTGAADWPIVTCDTL